ncbi:MAG: NigD-like C-terminal domain-containing protein, partial [Odoribacter sp.]
MKKEHLTSASGLLFILLLLTFSACHDDTEPLYEGYGLVKKTDDNHYSITLDDGNLLYPQASYLHPSKLRDSMRLYVLFNILKETDSCAFVQIRNADSILTKPILPYSPSLSDSVGNDPVKITKHWFAHGFLNFEFIFAGRYNLHQTTGHAHLINLLQCPSKDNQLMFEFRHNDFGDCRDKIYLGVVSFPIQKLLAHLPKPVKLQVKYTDSAHTSHSIDLL